MVDRGKGDGIYINTTGVGLIPEGIDISPLRAQPGDKVLISGRIAEHGMAIMSVREGLAFETELVSDSAPLNTLVAAVLDAAGEHVHVLRDPTRGGVSSALNEIAQAAKVGIRLVETAIPLGDAVRGACEILGLDPLYVANEGKAIAIVAPDSRRCGARRHARPSARPGGSHHRRSGGRPPQAGRSCGHASAASGSWTC